MAENTDKPENRLSVPYPILAVIVTIFLWAAGMTVGGVYSFATLSANQAAMNNALLIRDAQQAREREEMDKRHREEMEKMQRRMETMDVWIQTTREKVAKVEHGITNGGDRR